MSKYLPMPDSAGEWRFTGGAISSIAKTQWGVFAWYERVFNHPVLVTETPGAGRMCRELQMGGSAIVGFDPWSGLWEKVEKRTIVRRKKRKPHPDDTSTMTHPLTGEPCSYRQYCKAEIERICEKD